MTVNDIKGSLAKAKESLKAMRAKYADWAAELGKDSDLFKNHVAPLIIAKASYYSGEMFRIRQDAAGYLKGLEVHEKTYEPPVLDEVDRSIENIVHAWREYNEEKAKLDIKRSEGSDVSLQVETVDLLYQLFESEAENVKLLADEIAEVTYAGK